MIPQADATGMDTNRARQVAQESGVDIFACYQCEKCTNGCPVTFAMDLLPHAVLRMAQLGMTQELETAKTPWVCASCETCRTRCPNQIDIPRLMDWLKRDSLSRGQKPVEASVYAFHAAFLNNVARYGRVQETALMSNFEKRSALSGQLPGVRELYNNIKLGTKMLAKGRLSLVPKKAKASGRVSKLFSKD